MTFKIKTILIVIFLAVLSNAVLFFDIPLPILRIFVGITFSLFLPGFMILMNLIRGPIKKVEVVTYSVGISLVTLIFMGFFINQGLFLLDIEQPLKLHFLTGGIDLLLLLLVTVFCFKKIPDHLFSYKLPIFSILLAAPLLLLPVLSNFGATILNNGGSNILTIFMIICVALLVLNTVVLRSKLIKKITPVILYSIGLSLIFMYSLRSNYLIGWDIQSEYRVFIITLQNLHWAVNNFGHAYNTTLGITLLPTMLTQFLNVDPIFIFKYLYPVLFSFSGVIIYLLISEFLPSTIAFLSSFFFIAQFQFFEQMPALARQEIAMLLFLFGLLVFFSNSIGKKSKIFLFLLFNIGLIVCHYSTAYVALAIYSSTYISVVFLKILNRIKKIVEIPHSVLSLPVLVILFSVTFAWYGVFTGNFDYLKGVATQVISNISKIGSQEGKSQQAQQASGTSSTYTQADLKRYQVGIIDVYKKDHSWLVGYPSSIYEKYPLEIAYPQTIPSGNKELQKQVHYFIEFDQKIIKAAIILSLAIVTILMLLKKYLTIPVYFVIFSWSFLLLVVAAIFIPYISVFYNIERIYQQSLVFLGLFATLGLLSPILVKKIHPTVSYMFVSILFLSYFISYSGILYVYLGGPATLNLNNFGDEYERFFIHDTEKISAEWLGYNSGTNSTIFTDDYGQLKLHSFTKYTSGILTDLYPGVIDRNGYVYGSYANIVKGNVRVTYNSKFMLYSFPKVFLDENKNLVYSNSETVIYK